MNDSYFIILVKFWCSYCTSKILLRSFHKIVIRTFVNWYKDDINYKPFNFCNRTFKYYSNKK